MKPMWKQMFDALEQTAGPAMADATASDAFAEFAKVSSKISKDFNRQMESASREWLHIWNLPAAGDVQYLKRQVGSLEGEIRSLQRQNERFHRELLDQHASSRSSNASDVTDPEDEDGAPKDGVELGLAS